MKKVTLIVAIVASCAFFAQDIQAQQANRPARRGTNQMSAPGQMRMAPGQQMGVPRMMSSEQRTQMMADALKLSQEQQDKVKALFDAQNEATSKLEPGPARQEEMRKMMEDQNAKMKEILSEEQYKTYSSPEFRGMMMGRAGAQAQGPLSIDQQVERAARELKLTDEQKSELKTCLEAQAKENREFRTKVQGMSANERRTAQQKLRTEQQDKLKKVLGEDNYKKFQEMRTRFSQTQPGGMQMTPERQVEAMSRTLTLTDTQKTQLTEFFETRNKEMQGMREKMMNLTQEERRTMMQKNQTENQAKLKEILGEENYTKYQEQMQRQMRGTGMGGMGMGPVNRTDRPNAGERPQRRAAPQR
ncbi:MAG: hypothetical protein EOM03_12365 [Clostridia bacterium]|nr:hypothetical protein [Clostridia bacterium]